MKPTFRVHFSDEHPDRPGLWLSLRKNFISVLAVQEEDIKRDKRDPTWLDGQWGACLEKVDRDLVPLDRRCVKQHLDQLISAAHQGAETAVRAALQSARVALLGSVLELPPPSNDPKPEGYPTPLADGWWIPSPGTLEWIKCASFDQAMSKFEGFNLPRRVDRGWMESISVANERVNTFYSLSPTGVVFSKGAVNVQDTRP